MYGHLCTKFYDIDKQFASLEEIKFYKNFFDKNDLLLEPMCGSGRLLLPLLQEGYSVHGIDNSVDMLNSCKERAVNLGLKPVLFERSIESMQLVDLYDGIIVPLGSFQLVYPRSLAFQILEIFKNHLKPKGKLIMDLFVPWDALYENNEEEHSERAVKTNEGSIIKLNSYNRAHKEDQFILSKTHYTETINGKTIAQEDEEMAICWYYRYEIELILEKYGFKNIDCHERFLNDSPYMTFVAELE